MGQTVYLYPQTKHASSNVHQMLAVKVMKDPKQHWPMVAVEWEEGLTSRWELVHKDNIRRKSPAARNRAEEKEGDNARDHEAAWAKPQVMGGRVADVQIPDGMEQGSLF